MLAAQTNAALSCTLGEQVVKALTMDTSLCLTKLVQQVLALKEHLAMRLR